MKIVHIEDFFHPDAGYQINILPKYLQKFGHEQTIITSQMDRVPEVLTSFFGRENITERDMEYEKNGVKIIRLPLISFISGRAVFTHTLFKSILAEKPDVVYIHGNDTLTGIRILKKYEKLNCPIVTDSHMLAMASQNKLSKYFRIWYKRKITPILIKNKIPVIRTQNDPYVEKYLGIPLSLSPWISYGSDTLIFRRDDAARHRFRVKYGIRKNDFVFVYTGKLDETKGGKLLAEVFLKKFNGKQNIVLIVVGKSGNNDYGKEVSLIFEQSENRIIRFPTQKYIDLPKFYQAADVSLFAKQCSLSFYDAQGCGLPVLSERNSINIDRNSHGNGLCFKPGDIDDFRNKIQTILNMSDEEYKRMSDAAYELITQTYNYEDKAREYERIILAKSRHFKETRT